MEQILDQQAIVEQLRRIPLFSALDDEEGALELFRIAKLVQQAVFQPGEWIFKQGDPSRRLYIILDGRVRLYRIDRDGNTVELRTLEPGDWVGETGLLVGDFHDATAEALTPVRLLYLEQEPFLALLEERPRLRARLRLSREVKRRRDLQRYDWLRDDELVIFSVHRHPFFWFRRAIWPLFFLVLSGSVYTYFSLVMLPTGRWPHALIVVADALFVLLVVILVGVLLWQYMNWRDDYFVLTTQRIVHSERIWPFKWSFQEGALRNIQDIHEVRIGLLSSLFDFGDLILQTAGETIHIDLLQVPHPSELREMIFREIEREKAREVLRMREQIHSKLKERLAPHAPESPTSLVSMSSRERPRISRGLWSVVRDYLFPPSWEVSPDGTTVTWRRFWLVGLLKVALFLVLLALFFVIWAKWLYQVPLASVLFFLLEAALFFYALWTWEDWHNDYIQITPKRLIVVERKPLYLEEVRRETTLDRIQDINSNVPGPFARLLRCGSVILETAGTEGHFAMDWLRYPEKVQAEISRRQEAFIRQQQEAEANRRQEEILNWFVTYEAIKQGMEKERGLHSPTAKEEGA